MRWLSAIRHAKHLQEVEQPESDEEENNKERQEAWLREVVMLKHQQPHDEIRFNVKIEEVGPSVKDLTDTILVDKVPGEEEEDVEPAETNHETLILDNENMTKEQKQQLLMKTLVNLSTNLAKETSDKDLGAVDDDRDVSLRAEQEDEDVLDELLSADDEKAVPSEVQESPKSVMDVVDKLPTRAMSRKEQQKEFMDKLFSLSKQEIDEVPEIRRAQLLKRFPIRRPSARSSTSGKSGEAERSSKSKAERSSNKSKTERSSGSKSNSDRSSKKESVKEMRNVIEAGNRALEKTEMEIMADAADVDTEFLVHDDPDLCFRCPNLCGPSQHAEENEEVVAAEDMEEPPPAPPLDLKREGNLEKMSSTKRSDSKTSAAKLESSSFFRRLRNNDDDALGRAFAQRAEQTAEIEVVRVYKGKDEEKRLEGLLNSHKQQQQQESLPQDPGEDVFDGTWGASTITSQVTLDEGFEASPK